MRVALLSGFDQAGKRQALAVHKRRPKRGLDPYLPSFPRLL